MKILVSCLSKSWGGMEMFAVQSAYELLKLNFDVYLFCIKDSKIDLNSNFISTEKKLKVKSNSYLNLSNILRLKNFLQKNQIDLIHTQFSKDLWTISPALFLIKKHIPLVFTKQLGSFIVKKDLLHKKIYQRVDKAIAISTVIKKNLIETTPLDENKIVVIPNVVDLEKFNPANFNKLKLKKDFGIDENTFVFTNVARLSPGKGQDLVLKAISLVKNQLQNTLFLFVGDAEEKEKFYEVELKSFVQRNELSELVRFVGFRKDIPEILAMSDAFIFPSYAEAFGISLVEAMAMGLPNIVCNTDGVIDIILENKTSLTFQRDDYKTLSEHILKLRFDENLRITLSKNSLERAKEFSFENYNEKIINLYHELLK
ncbi:MAG: glycosyltransferase family 4 protein [Ignavibacteria bacterium]|nr:glycosyltransferase family 4 protein [Ignavibacteria bacterium]